MKISHKLCVRIDGTQFLLLLWFTAKNEGGNDKIAWVYLNQEGQIIPTTLLPAPPEFQTFLQPCTYQIIFVGTNNIQSIWVCVPRSDIISFGNQVPT